MVSSYFRSMMQKLFFTLFFSLLVFNGFSLNNDSIVPTIFHKEDYINKIDSLRELYGMNKTFISKIELQALVALSYYPELKDVKIVFRSKKLKTSMAARPTVMSAFKRKGKRKYFITLNDVNANIPFDPASFNAQVGVIGHELAHISYYEKQSKWTLIKLPFKYLNKKFRVKFERDTDMRTITHNLGWQLYGWKYYGENRKEVPAEYREYKNQFYMSSKEIYEQTILYLKSKNE